MSIGIADHDHSPPNFASVGGLNDQCEYFDQPDSEHQHRECYGIVVEPIPPLLANWFKMQRTHRVCGAARFHNYELAGHQLPSELTAGFSGWIGCCQPFCSANVCRR